MAAAAVLAPCGKGLGGVTAQALQESCGVHSVRERVGAHPLLSKFVLTFSPAGPVGPVPGGACGCCWGSGPGFGLCLLVAVGLGRLGCWLVWVPLGL